MSYCVWLTVLWADVKFFWSSSIVCACCEFVLCRLQLLLRARSDCSSVAKAFLALFQIRLPQAKRHPL